MRKFSSVDGNGEPVPWFTYPAIEQLRQWNLSDKVVFEFGCGNSTRFWAGRAKSVIAIEDNKEWFERLTSAIPGNVETIFAQDEDAYVESLQNCGKSPDIIVIDGSARC